MSDSKNSSGKGYELRGEVVTVGAIETVGAKGFRKRLIVIRTDDAKFPQEVPIYFTQDNCGRLDNIAPGSEATVTFDVRGREYNGRYYPELSGWKIVNHSAQDPAPTDQEPSPSPAPAASGEARPSQLKDEEDLPF